MLFFFQSDEIVKFIIFMLKELGIQEVPSLEYLKNKKFGSFHWENMILKVMTSVILLFVPGLNNFEKSILSLPFAATQC